MLGLHCYTNERHPQSWFTDGTLDWLWPAAERHPGLKLIVDHMGAPRADMGDAAYRFQPELLALAKYPNVAVKATGQAGYAEDEYRLQFIHLHGCFTRIRSRAGCSAWHHPHASFWRQCVAPLPRCRGLKGRASNRQGKPQHLDRLATSVGAGS
jgi:L-fuconolactonase